MDILTVNLSNTELVVCEARCDMTLLTRRYKAQLWSYKAISTLAASSMLPEGC